MANSFKSNMDMVSSTLGSFVPVANAKTTLDLKADTKSIQVSRYCCCHCQRVYNDEVKLRRHINNTHNKVKKFECSVCCKRFAYKHILQEHENLHYGLKPHVCMECGKRFAAKSNLIQHKRRHVVLQNDDRMSNTNDKATKTDSITFSCTFCTRRYFFFELFFLSNLEWNFFFKVSIQIVYWKNTYPLVVCSKRIKTTSVQLKQYFAVRIKFQMILRISSLPRKLVFPADCQLKCLFEVNFLFVQKKT